MSIVLSQLAFDNFQRANESPLKSPPWALDAHGDPGLAVVSDVCEAGSGGVICFQFYTGTSLPNDCYSSFTLASVFTHSASVACGVRTTDTGVQGNILPGYILLVNGFTGIWQIR